MTITEAIPQVKPYPPTPPPGPRPHRVLLVWERAGVFICSLVLDVETVARRSRMRKIDGL